MGTLDDRGIPLAYPFKPELELTPRQVKAHLDAGGVVIDCRTEKEWQTARVDGATLIPISELESRIDEIEELRDTPIAIMCHMGGRSMRATLLLRSLGFSRAMSVAGGIDLWSIDIDPSIPRY